ncbi:molybdate ABC transporter substrate-binding protein [Microbacterium sp. P06]|uniref:molybdate ABC transporter substrate-binding protein n=1 Tax=Microbacterium sp. P06 TaxID=3366949 RepID=UPI003744B6EA
MSQPTKLVTALLAVALAVTLSACAAASPAATTDGSSPAAVDELEGSITVFAAASLTTTFTELAGEFEAQNPGTAVALTFAGSSDLVTQITEGAPADVFASADEKNMAKLTDAELVDAGAPVAFATNTLEIVVPSNNPAGVTSFDDLADPAVKTVICAPQVPCGAAAVTVEEAAGIDIAPVSEESSVTDVLGKVTSGEADAGLVYVTDVITAGDAVEGIEFAEASEAVNTYPIAVVKESAAADVASAFVAFVTGSVGQGVLQAAGFGAP